MQVKDLRAMLQTMHRTPLDKIQTDEARQLVDQIVRQDSGQPPVEVARFGSSI